MLIQAEAITHRYRRGGEPVLQDVDHRFAEAAVTSVTGSSGSGKSTLLYLLALLLTPSAGTIRWGERNVADLPDRSRARLRAEFGGFVFQDALLDPSQTALDNVLEASWLAGVPRRVALPRARKLLDDLGVAERSDHRPGEISGGQAQRIALVRALINRPSVIFADEPTGNLDRATADVVWAVLAMRPVTERR